MKKCKYCDAEILNATPRQEMCDICRRIHRLEYDRLRNRIETKKSILEFFEWHKCVICREHIEWGIDVCYSCRKKRDLITQHLIKEFKKSVEEQQNDKAT